MTANGQEPERWERVPDGPNYEVSWDGNFRALPRKSASGRSLKAQPIATTTDKDGYVLVKYVNAEGKRVTRQMHRVQLEAFAGECPEGQEARHYDDVPGHNVWRPGNEEESRARGGNLFWGTWVQNRVIDRQRNSPAEPKPAKECVRCEKPFEGNGKRCHPCVTDIGRSAAEMLARGQTLAEVAKKLDYPSPEGIHVLAVRYGGYGARKSWWSRHVTPTLRDRLPGKRRSRTVTKRPAEPRQGGRDAPEGRKSVAVPPSKPGHSGTFAPPAVTQRDNRDVSRNAPKVTDSDQHPYPADSVWNRPERTRGGTSRRSRGAR
jgi:hypothetical protein